MTRKIKFLPYTSTTDFFSKLVYVFSLILSIFISNSALSKQMTNDTVWYRYKDSNGVINISSSVSTEHVKYGYEALDQNMQVLKKNPAYKDIRDVKNTSNRTQTAIQNQEDIKLKQAYGSSQMAVRKSNDALSSINKKIRLQGEQLDRTQKNYQLLIKQQNELKSQARPIPPALNKSLLLNSQNIRDMKKNLEFLQTNYRNTQAQYDTIIKRLKTFE